jgi:hypothetical protein
MDEIRGRYGHAAIARGMMVADRTLGSDNPKDDHLHTFPTGR